jgi:PIN domain nuclease of toxin-antitoxin system
MTVLHASAVLALLLDEPGADVVQEALNGRSCPMSALPRFCRSSPIADKTLTDWSTTCAVRVFTSSP